jgi:hypothetical protein
VSEAVGIHRRDTKNTEERKTASLLFILYKLERTLGLPLFRSFAGFVNFVVSLGEDLGWIEGIDFDGDQLEDFRQGRFEVATSCGGSTWWYGYADKTAALFAVNGVEVYVFAGGRYSPVLPEGQVVEMQPAPGIDGTWQWNPPGFTGSATTLGFGYTYRTISQYPCGHPGCDDWPSVGLLAVTNPAYFGFRIPHPGGWYLGWMRLEWVGRTPDGRWPAVQLVDYAVQGSEVRPMR